MGEYPGPRPPAGGEPRVSAHAAGATPPLSKKQQQEIAHARGRICRQRRCEVCAPLRERRHLKKTRRKAEAQAKQHAKGEPCGRGTCSVAICVEARRTTAAPSSTPATNRADDQRSIQATVDSDRRRRMQAERHRAGLPCGSEDCALQVCVDGFAAERARRHRAGRPCRSVTCDSPICVAGRSTG
jgi:hypothetical protein